MRKLAVSAVLVAAGWCAACGSDTTRPTFGEQLEDGRTGLTWILERSYEFDASTVQSVDCPTTPDTAPGTRFTCHLLLQNGAGVRAVDITMGDNASYTVGRPRMV